MKTHEVGGSASPHGGRATEAQSPSVPHRPSLVDGDRAPCPTDQHEEQEPRPEPQDEARAASGRRTSFKTSSVPSRSAGRVLSSKTTGHPRSSERVSRVTSQALGLAALSPHSCPLPSKPPGSPRSAERVPSQPGEPAASALGWSTSD